MASGRSRASRHYCQPMMERQRPAMLKDFLGPITPDQPAALHLRRSRTRSRAAVSALQKLLNNAVKLFPYAVKSSKGNAEEDAVVRVRVKDILRWTSFTRQVIDGPDHAGVGGEDPVWAGAGTGRVPYSDVGQTKEEDDEEEEQKSPVSVLDSKFTSHKQDSSSFDQALANVEEIREKLMERIEWFETLVGVDPCTNFHGDSKEEFDPMEETPKGVCTRVEYDHPKAYSTSMRNFRAVNSCVEECVGDMEKEATWSKFDEQCTQMGLELAMGMLNALLDELLFDLVVDSNIVS